MFGGQMARGASREDRLSEQRPILMPELFVNGVVFVVLLTPILMPEFFVNGIVFVVLLTPILMPEFFVNGMVL